MTDNAVGGVYFSCFLISFGGENCPTEICKNIQLLDTSSFQ